MRRIFERKISDYYDSDLFWWYDVNFLRGAPSGLKLVLKLSDKPPKLSQEIIPDIESAEIVYDSSKGAMILKSIKKRNMQNKKKV